MAVSTCVKVLKFYMKKISSFNKRYFVFSDHQGKLHDENESDYQQQNLRLGIFDTLVWLIPPQRCLFKRLEYDAEYVTADEVEECVKNDSQQWSIWPNTGMFIQKQKANNFWQVAVWIWDNESESQYMYELKQTPTHILPWSAYLAGCTTSNSLILQSIDSQHWLCVTDQWGLPSGIYPASTQAQQMQLERRFERQIEHGAKIYSYHYTSHWLSSHTVLPLPLKIKHGIFTLGKQKGITDFTDIKTYLKPLSLCGAIFIIWMIADFWLIDNAQQKVSEKISELSTKSQQAMTQRKDYIFDLKVIAVRNQYLSDKQLVGNSLAELTTIIPKDIYINTFEFNDPFIVISGTGKKVARLPALLEKWKNVKTVNFIGDIRQAADNHESFKLQIELKENI